VAGDNHLIERLGDDVSTATWNRIVVFLDDLRAKSFAMRLALALFILMANLTGQSPSSLPIAVIPKPGKLTAGRGEFALTSSSVVVADAALKEQGRQLAGMLDTPTGFDLEVRIGALPASGFIALRVDNTLMKTLGDEGYRLDATPKSVTIRAATAHGVFYGMQTLRQLLPVAVFRSAKAQGVLWKVPSVAIEDVPRFKWRGAHLDVSRHFMPKEFVKKYIDLLSIHKLNTFHWHLTDDQGWRLEIRKYPKLTEVGAWRSETLIGHDVPDGAPGADQRKFDGKSHGGFYTQDDVREIVAYAATRFVTVVPEIEMPGHSQEVVAAYPELGSADDKVEPRTRWGVSPYLLNPNDRTVAFMQDVLRETIELFPSLWIHIGGDEAVKDQWKANPQIQERIKELGLEDENALQSWFIRQMDNYLTSHGRRLIGWEEILDCGLASNAAVMNWRGLDGALAAARAKHEAVLTPRDWTYFDSYQSRDMENEPLAVGGFTPLDKVYAWEPMPDQLEPEFRKYILGVQGQLWSEYLPDPKQVEYMAFPRLTALSEVAWTPTLHRKLDDFMTRLAVHLQRLKIIDVNFRP
jgi:hexosaminidase